MITACYVRDRNHNNLIIFRCGNKEAIVKNDHRSGSIINTNLLVHKNCPQSKKIESCNHFECRCKFIHEQIFQVPEAKFYGRNLESKEHINACLNEIFVSITDFGKDNRIGNNIKSNTDYIYAKCTLCLKVFAINRIADDYRLQNTYDIRNKSRTDIFNLYHYGTINPQF